MNRDNTLPPVKYVVPISQMWGDDDTDVRLLHQMAQEAQQFLESFHWCKSIKNSYFGDGYGGIVAVFLFHIEPTSSDVDEWLWVLTGDVPPAYLVVNDASSPSEALEAYIEEMMAWVELAYKGQFSKEVIPVNVSSTPENAQLLEGRLKVFKETFVPAFRNGELIRAATSPSVN